MLQSFILSFNLPSLYLATHNPPFSLFFFFNDRAPPEIYPLSLHAALPIKERSGRNGHGDVADRHDRPEELGQPLQTDFGAGPYPFWSSHCDQRSLTFARLSAHHLPFRSEEHTSELQSQSNLVCRLLLEKKT